MLPRRCAVAGLLLAFVLAQALPWLGFGPAAPRTAVQAAAIAAPGLEICAHHPEGCPRDCLCPKIHQEDEAGPAGILAGPALVECTGKAGPASTAPAGLFLLPGPIEASLLHRIQTLPAPRVEATAPGFRPFPGKIPIA